MNEKKPFIRKYRKEDEQEVIKLVTEVLAEFGWKPHRKYDPDLYNLNDFYNKPGSQFFILEHKGRVIGTIGVENQGNKIAEIRKYFIRKSYRGKGFGSRIINHALNYCKKNKFKTIKILTDSTLKNAIIVYLKRNFVITGYKNGDLTLEKKILYM